jgi:hypothetical protein
MPHATRRAHALSGQVPLDGEGVPFPAYQRKLTRMLHAIDGGETPSADTTWAHHEDWLGAT